MLKRYIFVMIFSTSIFMGCSNLEDTDISNDKAKENPTIKNTETRFSQNEFIIEASKKSAEYYDDETGMDFSVNIKQFSQDNIIIDITNKSDKELLFGHHRELYRYNNNEWIVVDKKNNVCFTDAAIRVGNSSTVTIEESLWYYDELPKGKYKYSLCEFSNLYEKTTIDGYDKNREPMIYNSWNCDGQIDVGIVFYLN